MKRRLILAGVFGSVLAGALVSHAETWDKNRYADRTVESAYYDMDSMKVEGKVVSWTEKYILTSEGSKAFSSQVMKHQVCKDNIAKKGAVTQSQVDFQIEGGKYRETALRHYSKDAELLCSDKDMGNELNTEWKKIIPRSPVQMAKYDLVTKYKLKFPN